MPKGIKGHNKKPSQVEEAVVSCPGFVDEHGQWNNGFHCPKWGGPEQVYCCGTDTHLYCCPKPQDYGQPTGIAQHVPLVVGISVGSMILFATSVILCCYFCQCCWAYKRRKSRTQGVTGCNHHNRRNRGLDYAVNYSVCPHQACPPHSRSDDYSHLYGMPRAGQLAMYPLDDPPPYPGEPPYTAEEKQPLNPRDLVVMTEGPDDTPVTVAVGHGVGEAIFMQELSASAPHSISGVSPDSRNLATRLNRCERLDNTNQTNNLRDNQYSSCSSSQDYDPAPSYTRHDMTSRISAQQHKHSCDLSGEASRRRGQHQCERASSSRQHYSHHLPASAASSPSPTSPVMIIPQG